MIVVCSCGTKSRVRDVSHAGRVQCSKCKTLLLAEANRQAARNANVVLEVVAILAAKKKLTDEEETIAQIIAHHEVNP